MDQQNTSLADSQEIFSQRRLIKKKAMNEYYKALEHRFSDQFSEQESIIEDYPQLQESLIDQFCQDSRKIISALEQKIQKLKQHIATLEQVKKSTRQKHRYNFLKNKQEFEIYEWLMEIGLLKDVKNTDGMNMHDIIKQAKYKYLSNKTQWPSIKMIHNIEDLQQALKNQEGNSSIFRKDQNKQQPKKYKVYVPISRTNSEKKKKLNEGKEKNKKMGISYCHEQMRNRGRVGQMSKKMENSLRLRSGKAVNLTDELIVVVDREGQWESIDYGSILKVSRMKNKHLIVVQCKNGENWKIDTTDINQRQLINALSLF